MNRTFLLVSLLSLAGCGGSTTTHDDAGTAGHDAGATHDAAASSDAATPHDAGATTADTGTSTTDAGSASTDAGTSSVDTGVAATDAGSGATDAGASEADGGRLADLCTSTGGTVSSALCCAATGDFPNSCVIGACGCAPGSSHTVMTCSCPGSMCFSPGLGCVTSH